VKPEEPEHIVTAGASHTGSIPLGAATHVGVAEGPVASWGRCLFKGP